MSGGHVASANRDLDRPTPPLPEGPQLPALVQTIAFARDPLGVLLRARARHGDVFTLRFAGKDPAVVIGSAALALPIVDSDPVASHAGAARRAVLPQAARRSSFGADEAQHREARGRISPSLDEGRVERLRAGIETIADSHLSRWPRGRPFRVLSRMRALTEEIFVRLVLGADEDRAGPIAAAVGHALATPGNPPVLPLDRHQGPAGAALHALLIRRMAPLERLLGEQVEARRSGDVARSSGRVAGGILDHILDAAPEMSTAEIVEELIVVLAAAQEPPAIALTWVVERLAGDDALRERFLAADDRGPLRESVIDEVLRVRPPAMASLRRAERAMTIGGHAIAEGTDLIAAIPLVHRDPAVFDRPAEVDPERFTSGPTPDALIPFGGGARRCPAEALARMELRTIVPRVARQLQLSFPFAPERQVQRATVLVPHRSGLAIAR